MSQASQLSRYRPAVAALTGFAAAYGIWTLWNAFTPSKPLHRSNAIRRPRRPEPASQRVSVSVTPLSEEHPLGCVTVNRPDEQPEAFPIGRAMLPTAAYLQHRFDCNGEALRKTIASQAVWCILAAASVSRTPMPDDRSRAINDLGLSLPDIVAAALTHDPAALERSQAQISELLGGIDQRLILENFQDFPDFRNYLDGEHQRTDDVYDWNVAETEQSLQYTIDERDVEPSQGLKGLLYYIAEENAKRAAYEHRGITCEECQESPIKNIRWHCMNCADFDLCSTCEASTQHNKTHLFVKIKIPLPVLAQPSRPLPIWYPGNPHAMHRPISPDLTKRLTEAYRFESPQIDAIYDQFTCIANVQCRDDPSGVNLAIDRRAFDKALTSETWAGRYAPNSIYDRMFAFYDTAGKGFLFFEDFVSGIAYLRGPQRFTPLQRALRGFDVDDDGYIDRFDFLRLLRAKYKLQKSIFSSAALLKEAERTQLAADVLRSSQPISSIFSDEPIPPGGPGSRSGKQRNEVGDMEPIEGTQTVLNDGDKAPLSYSSTQGQGSLSGQRWRPTSLSRLNDALQGAEDPAADLRSQGRVDSRATPFTTEEAALLGVASTPDIDQGEVAPDLMWYVIEEGLHEMLNRMFKVKELLDESVTRTKEERHTWRAEIDNMLEERKRLNESLRAEANNDPLMATALTSHAQPIAPHQSETRSRQEDVVAHFREGMVPTDSETLDQLESEIYNQPLNELLNAAGYSIADVEETPLHESMAASPSTDLEGIHNVDPTLPHNRPSIVSSTGSKPDPASAPSRSPQQDNGQPMDTVAAPTLQRLEYLAQLDDEEKVIKTRGGPGRLSFDEIEAIVNADATRELKGLVTSWLEWASF